MYKILKDNKIILSEIPGKFAGYKPDKIFGTLSCKSGMRMKKDNRVFFHSMEDAIKQGYRPCKNCKPMNEDDFQKMEHLIPEKTLEEFYNRKKPMKYIKSYEGILFTNTKRYYIAKRIEDNFFVILETHPSGRYSYINVRVIQPLILDNIFNILTDEVAINTYEDEYGKLWEFLYSSTDLKEIKKKYQLYKSIDKYNL